MHDIDWDGLLNDKELNMFQVHFIKCHFKHFVNEIFGFVRMLVLELNCKTMKWLDCIRY